MGWQRAKLPTIPYAKLPARDGRGRTVWVTRSRPKIDRNACPWLVRRFVDPSAVFLFVAASEVEAIGERFNATPFDIENVHWSQRGLACDPVSKEHDAKPAKDGLRFKWELQCIRLLPDSVIVGMPADGPVEHFLVQIAYDGHLHPKAGRGHALNAPRRRSTTHSCRPSRTRAARSAA